MNLGVSADCRSMALGRLNIERAQPRCIDPPFIHRHSTDQAPPKRRLERIDFLGGPPDRTFAVLVRLVVIVEAEVDLGAVSQIALGRVRMRNNLRNQRNDERDPIQQVRNDSLDIAGIDACELADFSVVAKVANSAMNHSRAGPGSSAGYVLLFEHQGLEPSHRAVAGNPGAIHATADHDQIELGRGCHSVGSGDATATSVQTLSGGARGAVADLPRRALRSSNRYPSESSEME